MARRPKVLLVGPFPPTIGGVTRFMLNLVTSPLSNEFEFVPFTTSRPPKHNVTENWGYRAILRGGVVRILQGILITLWHVIKFPFVVSRVDLIQIQSSDFQVFWESSIYLLITRILRKPVLLRLGGSFDQFHATSPAFVQRLIERIINVPDVMIVQSEYWRELLLRLGRAGPLIVLPNWTVVRPPPSPYAAEGAVPVFLFIAGTEARRKGIDELLDALVSLSARGCQVRCRIVAVPETLRQRIERFSLKQVVDLYGPLAHDVLVDALGSADAFLLPSHQEGFPNSLLEAMAAGLPSIVTPVGAVPEVIQNGGALVVPVGDSGALADAMERLTRDPVLRRSVGEKARSIVLERYTADVALPPLEQAYNNLLGLKAATGRQKVAGGRGS